jgi:hypothetical protein
MGGVVGNIITAKSIADIVRLSAYQWWLHAPRAVERPDADIGASGVLS